MSPGSPGQGAPAVPTPKGGVPKPPATPGTPKGNQLPSIRPGDTLKDKAGYAAGQALDKTAQGAAQSYGVPPAVYEAAKRLANTRAGQAALNRTPVGKFLPQSVKDGFFGNGDQTNKKHGKKSKKSEPGAAGPDKAKGGKGKYAMALAVTWPISFPIIVILLILAMVMGAGMSFSDTQTQPDDRSDSKSGKYFPNAWQELLKQAADRGSRDADDFAVVPWTVLAGLVGTQTDFARYSPYDNIDRDPGRTVPMLPRANGGGGGDSVPPGSITTGAGPGPVGGVSGDGQTGSVAPGHEGPPQGDLSHQLGWFLWALRMHESNGNYTSNIGTGKACGAYQYMNGTWNNYAGYRTACDAPPSVQDRRVTEDSLRSWNKYKMWQQVAANHFYPAWAGSPGNWNRCPADCANNPTAWAYVDDVMKRMREISVQYPATQPASFRTPAGGAWSGPVAGVFADGCKVANPSPKIGGGKNGQGSGPYLLNPGATNEMRTMGLDPQNPCASSFFTASKLSQAAKKVHSDSSSPKWVPNGTAKDMANARKYWSKVIVIAGIFVDRSADPNAPCAIPPPDDPEKPWSVSFRIISIWRCEANRLPEIHLVIDAKEVKEAKDKVTFTEEPSRGAVTEKLVNEALSVSYGASKWKTEGCDNTKDDRQGIFPMTKQEAAAAGVADRCDVNKNINGAAKLVLSGEQVPSEERPAPMGPYQPMVGGWQNLGIAMGTSLDMFSKTGPAGSFTAPAACAQVMRNFLKAIAPYAGDFARLTSPPNKDDLYDKWLPDLQALERHNGITDPENDDACKIGAWKPGFDAQIAQIAVELADGTGPYTRVFTGLGNYYEAKESAIKPVEAVPGRDTLVIPRLMWLDLKEIGAPIAADALGAWSQLGTRDGTLIPLEQLAVEYAWFFGGVIAPFNSVGKLIGSLSGGSDTSQPPSQITVGPDGCPENAPGNTLREGAAEIGIHRLCVDSVAQARTPQAAMAVKWALTHLGWPYSQDFRNAPGMADCSSFVSRAYRDSGAIPHLYTGNAPVTWTFPAVRWMHQISLDQARPGDLVEPHAGHVAMQLADGYKVHTNMDGDVSKVERAYTTASWTGWLDPSRV